MPAKYLSSTALICRPDQLAEAAVVLSTIPPDGVIPVVVCEVAPVSREEYDKLYAEYTAARKRSMENVFGLEFRVGIEDIDYVNVQADIARHRELHARLSRPRSWLTHQFRWSTLLHEIPCTRAVFLFEPSKDDLVLWPVIRAKNVFTEESGAIIEEFKDRLFLLPDTQIICFTWDSPNPSEPALHKRYAYNSLAALTDLAWSVLQPGRKLPNPVIADAADPGLILAGLHQALEGGLPLRFSDVTRTTVDVPHWLCCGHDESPECVLVERLDSAVLIAAVLYAHHSCSQLLICPAPDVSQVDEAIANFRFDQQQATKTAYLLSQLPGLAPPLSAMSSEDKAALLDSVAEVPFQSDTGDGLKTSLSEYVKRYIFGDWRGHAMQQIERAVSSHLSPKLVEKVGDRPLTVFTSGIPYTFVRGSDRDWSNKPIGHVASDGPLIVAMHVWLSNKPAAKAPFAAIFDPGFFATTETRDVAAILNRQSVHLMVFSNAAATFDGLRTSWHWSWRTSWSKQNLS